MPRFKTKVPGCNPEVFQQRLKDILKEQGLSQRKVAIRADINPYIITKATRHAIVPSTRTLIKIADVLNVPLAYLIGDSDKKAFTKANPPTTFHARIKELSEEKGVKFSEMSPEMPFARNAIYEWLRTNTIPSLYYMKTIAAYFKVSLDYMTGRTNKRK